MSAYTSPGRAKGAILPVSHAAKTVHDTNALLSPAKNDPTCVRIWLNVTGAGNVTLKMWGGSSVAYAFGVGTYPLDGNFSHIMSTGTTATATYVVQYSTA